MPDSVWSPPWDTVSDPPPEMTPPNEPEPEICRPPEPTMMLPLPPLRLWMLWSLMLPLKSTVPPFRVNDEMLDDEVPKKFTLAPAFTVKPVN